MDVVSVRPTTLGLAAASSDKLRAKRIALDYHLVDLTERERALTDLAEKLTLTPRKIGQEDFDRLRKVGLSDEDILEAVKPSRGLIIRTASRLRWEWCRTLATSSRYTAATAN